MEKALKLLKSFNFFIRLAIITITMISLIHLYEIGVLGYFLIFFTGIVWAITSYID